MFHVIGLSLSLVSLGLVCGIYYTLVLSRTESWVRDEIPLTIQVALLTGMFPLALSMVAKSLWPVFDGGFGEASILYTGIDFTGVVLLVATLVVYRALLKATAKKPQNSNTVSPLPTRPVAPQANVHSRKKAA